ncbi:MAG: hypothetical protein IPI35_16530 [Deltaproteobacteria bacterium]|nr:hypothetical protein [Deltaproteobacteria bacterium]
MWRGTGGNNTSARTLQIHHVESVSFGPVETSPIDVIHRDRGPSPRGSWAGRVGETAPVHRLPEHAASAEVVEAKALPVVERGRGVVCRVNGAAAGVCDRGVRFGERTKTRH